jgi:hypothetical protein
MTYKNKFGVLAATAILLAGIVSSVAAQQIRKAPARINPVESVLPPAPPLATLSGSYSSKVNAKEVSAGDTQYSLGQTFGWTSYGTTNGDLSGYLFISLNYTLQKGSALPEAPAKSAIAPPQPISETSQVTGGSWSKLIFRDGKYLGSVSGRIVGGELVWDSSQLNATMRLELAADDGTDTFQGNTGKGTFEGTLDRSTGKGNVTGLLTLNF